MDVQTVEQTLDTLKQEQAALPNQIKQAVQRTQRSEVRRLQARGTELTDLIVDAELALIDARIAALPDQAMLDLALRQAEVVMRQAEQQHLAAVQRLVATQDLWRTAFSAAMVAQLERDKLSIARQEVALRAMPNTGEQLYSVTGHRM